MPFTEEEIWAAIKDWPSDRAPGLDGFTGAFYKSSWNTIKGDILAAFQAFHPGNGGGFAGLNNGLIVLLPKRQGAAWPGDFRPIAMIHSFGKLVSKVLASRLAPHMKYLVPVNQTAFIRGRSILDSFKYVQGAGALYRKKKIPKVLLKLDISKAFDTLSWAFLLDVLQALGFSSRRRDWIAILVASASSRVLVNGVPGPKIIHRRGVRQGDSLSPLLFVLAMDCLNRLVIHYRKPRVRRVPQGLPCAIHRAHGEEPICRA